MKFITNILNFMKKYSDKGESKKHEKSEPKKKEVKEHKAGKLPARMKAVELRKKVTPNKK